MSVLMPAPFLPFLESSLCTVYMGPVINGVVDDVCILHNFPGAGLKRALETEVKALKILISSCVSCVKPDSYYAYYVITVIIIFIRSHYYQFYHCQYHYKYYH